MSLPPEIIAPRAGRGSKLGNLIRRLGSNNDGELVATVHAMRRVLGSVGADFHAWAEHTEKPNDSGLSEAEAKKILDAGYAMRVQEAFVPLMGLNGTMSRFFYGATRPGSMRSTTSSSMTWRVGPYGVRAA
jgi:hypothetical protein